MMRDVCAAFAILTVAKPGYWTSMGLTTALNMTCLRPVHVDEALVMECEVCSSGPWQCKHLHAIGTLAD